MFVHQIKILFFKGIQDTGIIMVVRYTFTYMYTTLLLPKINANYIFYSQ